MGAAAYVGRVGGLAVALGVGSAVFAGQGVASADVADSGTSTSSTSATSPSESTDRSASVDSPGRDAPADDAADDAAATAADDAADEVSDDETDAETPDAETHDEEAPDEETPVAETPTDEVDPAPAGDPEPEPAVGEDDSDRGDAGPPPASDGGTDTEPEATGATEDNEDTDANAVEDTDTEAPTGVTTQPKSGDPGVPPQEPTKVAVFANASTFTQKSSQTTAALLTPGQDDAVTKRPTLITAVVNVVNSMIDWARQRADADPGDAPQPPFLWALMSFARRELDNLFAARTTSNAPRSSAIASTSLALAEGATTTAALVPSYSPWLNPQVSPSTNFVSWVTGPNVYKNNPLLANTLARYQVYGTDVGVMWDNGMVDDPSTPDINEHQVLIAVGDTFGSPGMTGRWIYNTLFRSSDTDLSDGMDIPNGEWFNGNMFGGAPLSQKYQARPIINRPSWAPNSVTLIPTAGVSVPTEVTEETPFGTIQYVSFMSVSKWGQAGRWNTNYSAIAYSTDNGENFTVAPQSVRYNSFLSANRNFQQSAFVKGDDGYVYVYGTPNGRQGAAYLARVAPEDILDVSKYEYYKKASSGWFGSTQAKWVKGSPSSASAIIGKSGGFLGFTKPGYTVSEMSVQYNEYLGKYIVLYGDQSNNIVMRTADTPEGTWSDATVLMRQQTGGIYAPMLHPWSPATQGTGSELYWNLSLWSEYNVMLMKTDLAKL